MKLPRFALALSAIVVSCGALRADDGLFGQLFHHTYDIITVTDATEAGRKIPAPTPDKPIRYKLIYQGQMHFGRAWAGEQFPDRRGMIKLIWSALKSQNYLLADETHPPEQLVVFGWGLVNGGGRNAVALLGGDKLNLLEEIGDVGGPFDPRLIRARMFRTGIGGQVWDITQDDYFIGIVRSYAIETVYNPEPTELWETHFGCASTGHYLFEAMPAMVAAAAPSFGRETRKPTATFYDQKRTEDIRLGDLQILEENAPQAKAADSPLKK